MVETQGVPPGKSSGLLTTKLIVPSLPSSILPRGPLLEWLELALEHKLTLLSAPAGFGKTTLMRSWVAQHQERCALAWLALDAGDNDPVRFWRYVAMACQHFEGASDSSTPPPGSSTLELLRHAQGFSLTGPHYLSFETVLTSLINDLARLSRSSVLILEDYHVLTETSIHETMATLIEHLPPTIHVILLSRGDLPLPLARLRAQGELLELRASDLRFTLAETRLFLQLALSSSLSEEMIARLQARTEGWIAGLKLVALALRERTSEQQRLHFLATFGGRYRHILEYLVSDVLNTQPEALQLFLLQTSGLSRLCGSLCNAVTGRNDSDVVLEQLERTGLFLDALDGSGEWYRYHALFAESMQQEVRRRLGEAMLRTCAHQASSWYEKHAMPTEAIESALQSGDAEHVISLIEHFADYQEYHTLRRWLEQLPQQLVHRHPVLCLLYANTLVFSMQPRQTTDWGKVEALLKGAEDIWREQANTIGVGIILSFRSLASNWQGAYGRAHSFAREALSLLPEGEMTWRGISRGILGETELYAGHLDKACQTIQESIAAGQAGGNPYAVRASTLMLAEVCIGQGELSQAEAYYRGVLANCEDDLDDKKKALFGLARLFYQRNELTAVEQTLEEVFQLGKQFPDESLQIRAEMLQVRVLFARGGYEQVRQHLQTLLVRAQSSPFRPVQQLYRSVLTWQALLQLTEGKLLAVPVWLSPPGQVTDALSFKQQEQEALLLARWYLSQGNQGLAIQQLEDRLKVAQELGQVESVLEIQMLLALAHADLKQASEARELLYAVLIVAQRGGYQRLFLDEGDHLQALLRTLQPLAHEQLLSSYIQQVLQNFKQSQDQNVANPSPAQTISLAEPLSPQEERVLRLMVTGRSNPEVARELIVSVNTIRTQVQSIYRKLNVNNRVEAIETARHLHLF